MPIKFLVLGEGGVVGFFGKGGGVEVPILFYGRGDFFPKFCVLARGIRGDFFVKFLAPTFLEI